MEEDDNVSHWTEASEREAFDGEDVEAYYAERIEAVETEALAERDAALERARKAEAEMEAAEKRIAELEAENRRLRNRPVMKL